MSMCAGKIRCEIYREKKFCGREGVSDEDHVCMGCRHAKRQCEVGRCVFEVNGMCCMMEEVKQ